MVFEKGNPGGNLKKGKIYEPTRNSKSWSNSKLIETITNKPKASISSEFSRNKKKLSDYNDVASYIDEYYKKDVRKNPQKYF